MSWAHKTFGEKDLFKNCAIVKPKTKQDRHIVEGTLPDDSTIESEGDTFQFAIPYHAKSYVSDQAT
jgi:hypothetical protein